MAFNTDTIKVVGLDLDQTLYPKSPEIDQAIQGYIYEKIAEHKGCPIDAAQKLFSDLYREGKGQSGSQTLATLGIPRPKEIVQEALENADIAKFLVPDIRTHQLLQELREKFLALDLITGSFERVTNAKLAKIDVKRDQFNKIITGETDKSNGSAFRLWLAHYPDLQPHNFLYIGDREKTDFVIPNEMGIQTILVNIRTPNLEIDCLQLSSFHDLRKYLLT